MRKKQSVCLMLMLAALFAAVGTGRAGEPAGKSRAATSLPPHTVKAWKNAGAKVIWLRPEKWSDFYGYHGYTRIISEKDRKPGDMPVFVFTVCQAGSLVNLPHPTTAFGLFLGTTKVGNADLKVVARFKKLQVLTLGFTPVTDQGLDALIELPNLHTLDLYKTQVTRQGLKALAKVQSLRMLDLGDTPLTKAGVKEVARLGNLEVLDLCYTPVTDEWLGGLAGLQTLHTLSLRKTQVRGTGLKLLSDLASLRTLDLEETPLTEAGLKEVAGLKNLQALNLAQTKVTNDGLKALARCKRLQSLDLSRTQVTGAGLKPLEKLKRLRTLSLSEIPITDEGLKVVSNLKNLQRLYLFSQMKYADPALKRLARVTEKGLEELGRLDKLVSLQLSGLPVTNEVLEELAEKLENLQELELADTEVTNKGLTALAKLGTLQELNLANTQVTNKGLKALARLTNLRWLSLANTQVTGDGLKALAPFKKLRSLDLQETKVGDEGLRHLRELKNLTSLYLWKTKVTDAGVRALKEELPGLQVSRTPLFPLPPLLSPFPPPPKLVEPLRWENVPWVALLGIGAAVLAVIAVIILAAVGWKIGMAIGRGKTRAPPGTPGAAPADFAFPIPPLEDLILSAKEVEADALQTWRLLEELARRDPAFDPSSLDAFIRATFLRVQRCWEERDYGPVRDLLVPSLLAEHEGLLQAMRRDGLINRIESLTVQRLEFVHAFCPEATDRQEVTALITFDARLYFVYEGTGMYAHGAQKVLPYQEYWVFCRRGDTWRLLTINRDQVDHCGLRAGAEG
jgi:Leucine-rich repeat (LRR) protein